MKYINTHYSLFDMASNMRYVTTTINNVKSPCFGGGEAKINLNAETTKLYIAFDIQYDSTYAYMDGYPIQVFFSDGGFGIVKPSTIQFYLKPSGEYITLDINGKELFHKFELLEEDKYKCISIPTTNMAKIPITEKIDISTTTTSKNTNQYNIIKSTYNDNIKFTEDIEQLFFEIL